MASPPRHKTCKRKATSADVARAAGVSRTTVSLILNEVPGVTFTAETINRVKREAAKLGYFPNVPARSVTTKKSYAIGLVSFWEPNSTLFARSFAGMIRYTRSVGYGLTVCDVASFGDDGIEATIEFYKQGRIDGVVALLSTFWPHLPRGNQSTDYIARLKQEHIPFVLINSHVGDPTVDEICTDNFHAGYLATQHLLSLGHRHIGIMSRQAASGRLTPAESERYRGCVAALAEVDGTQLTECVCEGSICVDAGYQGFNKFIASGAARPTALYAISDYLAIGAIYAAQEHGLVIPHDLAVVGTDDLEMSPQIRPALTSVRQPLELLGEQAVQLLLQRIDERGPDHVVKAAVPCSLQIRHTCGGMRPKG